MRGVRRSRLPPGWASHRLSGTVQASGPAQPGSGSCSSRISSLRLQGAQPPLGAGVDLGGISSSLQMLDPSLSSDSDLGELGQALVPRTPLHMASSSHGLLRGFGHDAGMGSSWEAAGGGSPLESGPSAAQGQGEKPLRGPQTQTQPSPSDWWNESPQQRGGISPLSPPPLLPLTSRGRIRRERWAVNSGNSFLHSWREPPLLTAGLCPAG